MGLCKLIVLAAMAAGVANAEIPQIGCKGDCDRVGYNGLGGGSEPLGRHYDDDCGFMAAALNKLDGVSGVECGGYYPFLFFDGEKAGDKCNTVAAILNKLDGVSSISCSDDQYNFLVVPAGNCPAVPAKLTAILQGPTCKHGNPISGPSGGGNCTGACDKGWQGSNCDSPSPPTAPVALAGASDQLPTTMRAMQKTGWFPCSGPEWSCLSLNKEAPVPQLKSAHALVKVMGSSVNPKDVECVEPICLLFRLASGIPFRCSSGTLGGDSILNGDCSGVVVAAGDSCPGIEAGDEVWGFCSGAYAEYALASCDLIRPKPTKLTFIDAGSLPGVAVTAVEVFTATGAPWTPEDNKTVVITAGQGGTGFIAVQVAKMLGAARVITAATGAGIPMLKSLGADVIIDYHKQELFAALKNDTVDVVFDNHGAVGTADSAMPSLRAGGVFLLLTGGGKGKLSENAKAGVKQMQFPIFKPSGHVLDVLADGFNKGLLRPRVIETFSLSEVPQAFTRSTGHGVLGKIAVDPSNSSASKDEEAAMLVV